MNPAERASDVPAEVIPLPGLRRHAVTRLSFAVALLGAAFLLFPVMGWAEAANAPAAVRAVVVVALAACVKVGLFFGYLALQAVGTWRSNEGRPGALTIGDDGLLVRRGISRDFYPLERIHSVTTTAGGLDPRQLLFVMFEGGGYRLICGSEAGKLAGIAARVEAARQRHLAQQPVATCDAFARGERSVATWRAGLAEPVDAFRVADPPPEAIAEVLASPLAPLDARVGAALALRRLNDGAERRIRVAASAAADPRVRAALEAVAAEEIDEALLEEALSGAALR